MALVERTGRAVNSRALPRSDFLSETSLEAAARVRDPGFPGGSVVKNLPANAGDTGLTPRSGRSHGKENGNPLQCSCLGNPKDRGAWQATVHGVTKESNMT